MDENAGGTLVLYVWKNGKPGTITVNVDKAAMAVFPDSRDIADGTAQLLSDLSDMCVTISDESSLRGFSKSVSPSYLNGRGRSFF